MTELKDILNDLNELHELLLNERNEAQRVVNKIEQKRIKVYHAMQDISDKISEGEA